MPKIPAPHEIHVEAWNNSADAWKLALEIGDTIMALRIGRRYRAGVHQKRLRPGEWAYYGYIVDRFPSEPPVLELAAYYIRSK